MHVLFRDKRESNSTRIDLNDPIVGATQLLVKTWLEVYWISLMDTRITPNDGQQSELEFGPQTSLYVTDDIPFELIRHILGRPVEPILWQTVHWNKANELLRLAVDV